MLPIRLLPVFALAACATEGVPEGASEGSASSHKALVEMFVMSQCPYGVEVENAIGPVADKLGDSVDVQLHYIGQGAVGSLSSMHGANEVMGDLVQVCANAQDHAKVLDLVLCQNENPRAVHENWRDCGTKVGYDVARLETCANGDEGQKLLADSFELARTRGARGSPTIFLDGQPYEGGRKTNDFLRAVCGTYGEDAPAVCADIPVPPKVDAIFLSDARCAQCDLHKLEPRLKGQLGGLQARYVDYSSEEGRTLYATLQSEDPEFKFLPVVLLSPDASKDVDGFAGISKYTRPLGDYLELRLGGQFDPTAEICDNAKDDDGDSQVDCADSGCAEQMVCREKVPEKLDLFVMSHCPYGAKALIATEAFLGSMGRDIDLDVHFIGNDAGGTLSSMHGQAEVDDDLREACAQKHYPSDLQFMKYMACFSKDYRAGDWKACAAEAGMSASVIESCATGSEGQDLVRKSFAQAASLGISSSPTFLVNNTRTFNAVDPAKLQTEFCRDNPTRKGCDTPIAVEAATGAAPAQADAACGN